MITSQQWSVDLYIDEHDDQTRAEARLHTHDKTDLRGKGLARRNPHDRNVPEIGAELAASRALSDLAHRLLDAAVADVEQATHEPAHFRS